MADTQAVSVDNFLAHYGVKGMKWGVRHTPITKLQQKAHAKANDDMNKKYLPALNKHPKYAGKNLSKSPSLRKQYEADAEKIFDHAYSVRLEHAQFKRKVKTGVVLSSAAATVRLAAYYALVHAEKKEAEEIVYLKLNLNALGQIESVEEVESLEHSATETFLSHFGIRGMKWGVRRTDAEIQRGTVSNPDGTRTRVVVNNKTRTARIIPEDQAQNITTHELIKKYGTDAISTKDLQSYVNRVDLEKRYSNLVPKPQIKKGRTATVASFLARQGNTLLKNEVEQLAKGKKGPLLTLLDSKSASGGKHKLVTGGKKKKK